ncbi:hypothetical protein [Fodinibius sediminis]|uniref:Uracil DNA glycosylase superfamily protein n=1 Tax=Fodinibius sediminis TaxID=1214077 RepID=A0A521F8K6_9BACT|nr:hypothetical protein [Fodinibius sediminis]SMO92542.1 hypothetical protein SAMN06265218_12618 [Fodinibius sediminis]
MLQAEIWNDWEEHYENINVQSGEICKDGIINNDKYEKSDPKILFVLKEVNKYGGGDLCHLLKNGPKYQMWHAVARWSAGILNDFPPFSDIDNKESKYEAIHSIASINLKKTTGKASANKKRINAFAYRDRELLLKQIELISPDIIIAGGTFDILIWLLGLDIDPQNPEYKPVTDSKRDLKVVPWRHPARVNNKKTYRELKELFRSA